MASSCITAQACSLSGGSGDARRGARRDKEMGRRAGWVAIQWKSRHSHRMSDSDMHLQDSLVLYYSILPCAKRCAFSILEAPR